MSDRTAATTEMLLAAARAADMALSADLRVSEADLETLLAYSPRYLRRLRDEGAAPPCYRLNGRPTYRLPDVALWIELSRDGA